MLPHFKFAALDDNRLAKLKAIEAEHNIMVLALEPATHQVAQLTAEQVAALQALEQELGLVLVALQPKTGAD